MDPTVLTQIAYQALSESLQTFSEFKYLTSKNFKNSETLSKIDPNPRKIPSDSCTWLNVNYGVGLKWDEKEKW